MAYRTARVGNVIQAEITQMLARGRLKDPRIHGFTTITGVKVSSDLSHARVFFTVSDDEAIEKTREGLQAARGFIQRQLGKALQIRAVPAIDFAYDPSIAEGDRMSRILAGLPELQQPPAAEPEEAADTEEETDEGEDTGEREPGE